jgi:very-short-patch-repair endonuclease
VKGIVIGQHYRAGRRAGKNRVLCYDAVTEYGHDRPGFDTNNRNEIRVPGMNRKPSSATDDLRGEVLVAIMRDRRDFGILQEQLWYRVPVDTAPKRWPPQWLAFYQTKIFRDEAWAIHYYGRVRSISVVSRTDLFPDEFRSRKSERHYYQVHLESLQHLLRPISSERGRRLIFVPTTWAKFTAAEQINDLFDDSPLEDRLWAELKRLDIDAERQYGFPEDKARYMLDFAVFCNNGKMDIETDGDTYHTGKEIAPRDNRRNNALATAGWLVLRFTSRQIGEEMAGYCVPEIKKGINGLGGLRSNGVAPRRFVALPEGDAQQLSLFG